MGSITGNDDNDQQFVGGSGEIISTNKECTSYNNVDTITEGIKSVSMRDVSTCASCGKEGNSHDMNTCNKCKMVKYCNAACKKKHRSKHKKACERRVAELHDEQLFKDPPPREECPICLLTMPHKTNTSVFMPCCGKRICNGCIYAMKMSEAKDLCAFCRTPPVTSDEEHIRRVKKLMEKRNAGAFNHLAGCYSQGIVGLPQDYQKANELCLKAGELGCAVAYYNLGNSYRDGEAGVERDDKKAQHYWELAAMGGSVSARYNLGVVEGQAGNHHRAYKHYVLAARAGHDYSLDIVKDCFMSGFISKDEYARTLRAYHERQKEMKSDARDMAASSSGIFI